MTTRTTRFFLRAAVIASIAFLAACSGTAGTDGGTDTPIVDARGDTANDVASDRADVSIDSTMDVPVSDTPVVDSPVFDTPVVDSPAPDAPRPDVSHDDASDGSACSPTQPCHPFFCGCGSCNPADIICVSDSRGCPLACPFSCPELATTVCECTGGSCAVVQSDGGPTTDSGGGGTTGSSCTGDGDCMTGLLCCYPCGIPGCTNQCMPPMGGHCPLFP